MYGDEEKPTVTIRASGGQNCDRASRDALLELQNELASDDYEVRFPLLKTAGTVQNSLEGVGIFIAGNVSGALLTLMVTDTYNVVKRWLHNRFTRDSDASAV